jgi:hypothetical protein
MYDEQKIELTPPSSIDNDQRKELLWERREEDLITAWAADCLLRHTTHTKKEK